MPGKHLALNVKLDLYDMLTRYNRYGWSKQAICRKWGLSMHRFYGLDAFTLSRGNTRPVQVTAITETEKKRVIDYALSHTELNHREMSYRMIDEDVACMSPSSVYRILSENNLLNRREKRDKSTQWNPHEAVSEPDGLWQTDLLTMFYRGRHYYSLSYIDVFSRFVVYQETCLSMTGDTIGEATDRAFDQTGKIPNVIQSDNGSCYISSEYRTILSKAEVDHRRIHPHCPNENAEIERYHRTFRELVYPDDADDFQQLGELIKERIHYYNYTRYHSAIGYVTPAAKYTGKAEKILDERKQKLEKAKKQRIQENIIKFVNQPKTELSKAA
jgi:transposase InsO family protein